MNNHILPSHIDANMLAGFCEEALCGLGVADDADELIIDACDCGGVDHAREVMDRYNTAICFVNSMGADFKVISEEEFQEWVSK